MRITVWGAQAREYWVYSRLHMVKLDYRVCATIFAVIGPLMAVGESGLARADGSERPASESQAVGPVSLGVLLLTSEPSGSRATVASDRVADDPTSCLTPCRLRLAPGNYRVIFTHRQREPLSVDALVTIEEQVQVHALLGQGTPWKLIVPAYFVGSIFSVAGVSSILVHRDTEPVTDPNSASNLSAEERRFHRNLGITSLAIGIPVLALATYLLLTGHPGEVRTFAAPGKTAVSLAPMTHPAGDLFGITFMGRF